MDYLIQIIMNNFVTYMPLNLKFYTDIYIYIYIYTKYKPTHIYGHIHTYSIFNQ